MKKQAPSGILPRKYKSGSIIYFESDKSEYIYILKAGRIILTSVKLDTGEEVKEEVRQGEFFGVKSSLGKYPREETAQVIGDTDVLIMNLSDFERLILRNVNVVLKMLRVFSNQLRKIGKTVRSVLGDEADIKPEVELFKIGEYYFKAGSIQHARYAFKKYLEYYPDQNYAKSAMSRIKAIDSGQVALPEMETAAAVSREPVVEEPVSDFSFEDEGPAKADMVDFENESLEESKPSGDSDSLSPLSSEMSDFISDEKEQKTDDFSFDDFEIGSSSPISDNYKKAQGLMNSGDYGEAIDLFNGIVGGSSPAAGEEKNHYESGHVELGKCYMKAGKPKEALDALSSASKKFPGTKHEKNAFFQIGMIFESVNRKDKAVAFYGKVANMAPKDDLNSQAMKKLKQLQG